MTNIPDVNDICKCCGYDFGSHSVDGLRCPKNGGHLIDGRLEYFASHFEPEISETDQLRARIATLEELYNQAIEIIKEKNAAILDLKNNKGIPEMQDENARLTADAKLNDMAWNDNQAALNVMKELLIKAESALTYANWDGQFDKQSTAQDVINARDAIRDMLEAK